jgi:hypothetical protein
LLDRLSRRKRAKHELATPARANQDLHQLRIVYRLAKHGLTNGWTPAA